jgi:hypothetical protein
MATKSFAANLDQLLVLVAVEPMFSETQLARALIAAESAGIPVTIVLNKTDLPTLAPHANGWRPTAAMGVPVLETVLKADRPRRAHCWPGAGRPADAGAGPQRHGQEHADQPDGAARRRAGGRDLAGAERRAPHHHHHHLVLAGRRRARHTRADRFTRLPGIRPAPASGHSAGRTDAGPARTLGEPAASTTARTGTSRAAACARWTRGDIRRPALRGRSGRVAKLVSAKAERKVSPPGWPASAAPPAASTAPPSARPGPPRCAGVPAAAAIQAVEPGRLGGLGGLP